MLVLIYCDPFLKLFSVYIINCKNIIPQCGYHRIAIEGYSCSIVTVMGIIKIYYENTNLIQINKYYNNKLFWLFLKPQHHD